MFTIDPLIRSVKVITCEAIPDAPTVPVNITSINLEPVWENIIVFVTVLYPIYEPALDLVAKTLSANKFLAAVVPVVVPVPEIIKKFFKHVLKLVVTDITVSLLNQDIFV